MTSWYKIIIGGSFPCYLQVPGDYPPAFPFFNAACDGSRWLARELSIFVDESGDMAGVSCYYLMTLVLHDQANDIREKVRRYEESLSRSGLPNIPFHSGPLLNGHGDYAGLTLEQRKKMLVSFNVLVQRLPIRYRTFAYRRSEYSEPESLSRRMRRDIASMLVDDLAFFQGFDVVKVYYDDGQAIVSRALYGAIGDELSKEAVCRKWTIMTDYRLEQAADYLCTIELAALRYADKEDGQTYNKFFGGVGKFKRNWLKQARRKAF